LFYREVPVCPEAVLDLQVYDVDAKAELVPESALVPESPLWSTVGRGEVF